MSSDRIEMTEALYEYLDQVSFRDRPILAEHRAETARDARRNMAVSAMQGQFMEVLVRALNPKRIVEVGVYTGYSSLIMGQVTAPDAKIWCFDVSEEWTNVARRYWEKAGVDGKIELRLKPGKIGLEELLAEGHGGTMDLVFIDADKGNYISYWNQGIELLRTGGLVIADNTLFQSMVVPTFSDDDIRARYADRPPEVIEELIRATHGARAFNEMAHMDERVSLSMVPVGDGMTFGVKL